MASIPTSDSLPGRDAEGFLCRLAGHDPDLAYLALLAARAIKPAGRWTLPLPGLLVKDLCGLGLTVREVRRLGTGSLPLIETIFAADPMVLESYALRFAGRPLASTPELRRHEGRLLGYPACCVDQFIERAYAPNSLAPEDQALLFHWACPACAESARLVPRYREIREAVWSLQDRWETAAD